jgi:hypothetical protein
MSLIPPDLLAAVADGSLSVDVALVKADDSTGNQLELQKKLEPSLVSKHTFTAIERG